MQDHMQQAIVQCDNRRGRAPWAAIWEKRFVGAPSAGPLASTSDPKRGIILPTKAQACCSTEPFSTHDVGHSFCEFLGKQNVGIPIMSPLPLSCRGEGPVS
jgi:hypothetical protein